MTPKRKSGKIVIDNKEEINTDTTGEVPEYPPNTSPNQWKDYINVAGYPKLTEVYSEQMKDGVFTIPSSKLNFDLTKILFEQKEGIMKETIPEGTLINVETVVSSELKSDGFAEFDPNKFLFTVTIPPHVELVTVNTARVLAHYNGNTRTVFSSIYDYPDIFSIKIDETQKPACTWYSPSLSEITDGAMQLEDYPYSRGRKDPSCSNPAVSGEKNKIVNCNYAPNFNSCHHSNFGTWEDVTIAYKDDKPSLSIQRMLFANKMPYYRIYDHETDTIVVNKTDQFGILKEAFEEKSHGLFVRNTKSEKRSYFKAVLV